MRVKDGDPAKKAWKVRGYYGTAASLAEGLLELRLAQDDIKCIQNFQFDLKTAHRDVTRQIQNLQRAYVEAETEESVDSDE